MLNQKKSLLIQKLNNMELVHKILFLLLILVSILQNWLFLTTVLVIFYSIRCGAVSLIPLAFLLDGYFGNFYTIPFISLSAVVWYVLVSYMRPKIVNLNFT
jgi:hypothetical protein